LEKGALIKKNIKMTGEPRTGETLKTYRRGWKCPNQESVSAKTPLWGEGGGGNATCAKKSFVGGGPME